MSPSPRTLTRLAAALAMSVAVMPSAVAQPAPSATVPAVDVPADSPRLEAAQARRDAAQARVDAASADLARIRGELFTAADPAETARLRSEERDAQERKDALVAELQERDRQLTGIAADVAREAQAQTQADRAAGVAAPDDPAADSPTGIVLAPVASPPAATGADPASGTLTADGAVSGSATPAAPTAAPGAASIDAYLAAKLSPLTGMGSTFVAESARVGLDPRLLVAIAGAETSFGTYGPSQAIHNPFGLGPGMSFPDWATAIRTAAQNLGGRLYRGSGLVTIPAINGRWAPAGAANDPTGLNGNWGRNVSHYLAEQGGDPSAPVFTGVSATPASVATPSVAAAPASADGAQAAQVALTLLGTPYGRSGGPGGLDAGGLVQAVYGRQGVALPSSPAALARRGTAVEPAALRSGDAVFFSDPDGRVVHVGVYLGAGQFVHAPGPGDVVGLGSLYDPVWATAYAGARRY